MAEIITFYGTDGSGKSTLAHEFSSLQKSEESLVLGGSSYKSWLTPNVAKQTLGNKHRLAEVSSEPKDQLRLYEDIAIACYGLARILVNRGSEVIIDSDPFLKRVIWGTLGLRSDMAIEYVSEFGKRMDDILDKSEGPDVIIGVNMDESSTSREDLLLRLASRESSTSHDPADIETLSSLDNRVGEIWKEIKLSSSNLSSFDAFNNRVGSSTIISIQNPTCPPEDVTRQAKKIAHYLRTRV